MDSLNFKILFCLNLGKRKNYFCKTQRINIISEVSFSFTITVKAFFQCANMDKRITKKTCYKSVCWIRLKMGAWISITEIWCDAINVFATLCWCLCLCMQIWIKICRFYLNQTAYIVGALYERALCSNILRVSSAPMKWITIKTTFYDSHSKISWMLLQGF